MHWSVCSILIGLLDRTTGYARVTICGSKCESLSSETVERYSPGLYTFVTACLCFCSLVYYSYLFMITKDENLF